MPLEISDNIRASFRSKLWRMGLKFCKLGSKSRTLQLNNWKEGKEATRNFMVNDTEVNRQLLNRKRKAENLEVEMSKRKKCEEEITTLQAKLQEQTRIIEQSSHKKYTRKPLSDCTRQQQYNRKKEIVNDVQNSLSHCKNEGFRPHLVELEEIDTGENVTLDLTKVTFSYKSRKADTTDEKLYSALYIKDNCTISNAAYHELSIVSNLPSLSQIKKLTGVLNLQHGIKRCPNNIIGVQQGIKIRIIQHLTHFVKQASEQGMSIPETFRIKITVDGTQIARGLNIVNVTFTILEEKHKACSVFGNYSLAILKIAEDYEELRSGLQNICEEAADLQIVTIQGKIYNIQFFLGGDWKYLATICGIESVGAEYSCFWCKCPKSQRYNTDLEWSITDPSKGTRTTQEIKEKSMLSKSSKV